MIADDRPSRRRFALHQISVGTQSETVGGCALSTRRTRLRALTVIRIDFASVRYRADGSDSCNLAEQWFSASADQGIVLQTYGRNLRPDHAAYQVADFGYAVPLPPYAEQRRIVAEVERRLSVIDELEMQVEANLKRAERLRQAILKRAFEGKLVPQDPNDEPASMLLERIKAAKAGGDTATPGCA